MEDRPVGEGVPHQRRSSRVRLGILEQEVVEDSGDRPQPAWHAELVGEQRAALDPRPVNASQLDRDRPRRLIAYEPHLARIHGWDQSISRTECRGRAIGGTNDGAGFAVGDEDNRITDRHRPRRARRYGRGHVDFAGSIEMEDTQATLIDFDQDAVNQLRIQGGCRGVRSGT